MAEPRDPHDFGPPPTRPTAAASGYGSRGFDDPVFGGGSGGGLGERTFAAPPENEFDRTYQGPALADPYVVVRTPVIWLALAILLGAAGAVLALLLGGTIELAVTAWVLAGPLAIGLLAVHSLRDTALRTRLGYDRRAGAGALYLASIVVAAIGIGISAWRIAEWAGRL